jgi:HlyD family secretion protein
MKKNKLLIFLILTIFTLILLIIYLPPFAKSFFNHSKPLKVSGYVEAEIITISSQFNGLISKIHFSQGNKVKKGQLLLESSDLMELKTKLLQTAAQIEISNLNLAKTNSQLTAMQYELNILNLEYAQTKEDFSRTEKLYYTKSATRKDYNALKRKKEITAQKIQKFQKEQKILQKYDRAKIQKQIEILQAQKYNLYNELKKRKVRTPISGIITQRYIEEGELTSFGKPLFEIINPQNQWVYVYIPEKNLGKISLNQKVTILNDTFPQQKILGHIVYIAPLAEFTPQNIQLQEDRVKTVFKVKIKVQPNQTLKPGMPVDVVL